MFLKRKTTSSQKIGLKWSIDTRPNDYVLYLEGSGTIANTVDDLFQVLKDTAPLDTDITKLVDVTTDGMVSFTLSNKDKTFQDTLTYEYTTTQDPGIIFRSSITFNIVPLELVSKLPTSKLLFNEKLPLNEGFSNYYYTRYFMPKWSTAYKYPYSVHSRTVEPIFTDIMYYATYIKALVTGKDLSKLSTTSSYKLNRARSLAPISSKTYSNKNLDLLAEHYYIVDEDRVIEFGSEFTTLYIESTQLHPEVELIVTGLSNNAFIDYTFKLKSKGFVKLPIKFSKVFSIKKTSYNIDKLDNIDFLTVKLTNALNLDGFIKESRNIRDIEYSANTNRLVLYNSDTTIETVFSFSGKKYSNIFVDKDDNIVCSDDLRNVYTGKLDAKINLNIPQDMSINNSPYIEICNLDLVNYNVDLYLKKFIMATNTQRFSISIEDSKGQTLHLNKSLDLVDSDEKIFMTLSEIFQDTVSITLEMEEDLEYVIIRIEDWDNLYSTLGVIVQPVINLERVVQLPNDKNNSLVLIEDKLSYINENQLITLEG